MSNEYSSDYACTLQRHGLEVGACFTLDDKPGAALADAIRRHHSELRSIFLADAGTPRRDGIVVRPFTRDDLLLELNAICAAV